MAIIIINDKEYDLSFKPNKLILPYDTSNTIETTYIIYKAYMTNTTYEFGVTIDFKNVKVIVEEDDGLTFGDFCDTNLDSISLSFTISIDKNFLLENVSASRDINLASDEINMYDFSYQLAIKNCYIQTSDFYGRIDIRDIDDLTKDDIEKLKPIAYDTFMKDIFSEASKQIIMRFEEI